MSKKNTYEDRLKYMHMLEEGYSFNFIHTHYGISNTLLLSLWEQYKVHGASALVKKANVRIDVQEKIMAIEDFEINGLSLDEVMQKYNVSQSALSVWRKRYLEGGAEALKLGHKGRPPEKMGRPKKKEPQTELEKLQAENERLRAENALLKKVKALVEEREARQRLTGLKSSKN